MQTSPIIFHVTEGGGRMCIEGYPSTDGSPVSFVGREALSAPGYTQITLTNNSATAPLFSMKADEYPLHEYLGIY